MKRHIIAGIVLVAVFCGRGAFGADKGNPPMRSRRIKVVSKEESTFVTRNQFGQCRGTFVSGTNNRIKIIIMRGYKEEIAEIPLFYFGAAPVFQFVGKTAKIPQNRHRIL